ncbi:MAG: hypothetical protein WAN35_21470 [Terracidiphilus sp.]
MCAISGPSPTAAAHVTNSAPAFSVSTPAAATSDRSQQADSVSISAQGMQAAQSSDHESN